VSLYCAKGTQASFRPTIGIPLRGDYIVIKNMHRNKPLTLQFIIVGGFLVFLYIFFALATSIYRDYKLDMNIEDFQSQIDSLAELAGQKPKDVKYFQSDEYKDRYAKENLNLLNPGEKLIIIPDEEQVVKSEVVVERYDYSNVLKLPNRNQWWEYFFGRTLSVQAPEEKTNEPASTDKQPEAKSNNINKESRVNVKG